MVDKVALLTGADVSKMKEFASRITREDFPEYPPEVSRIYAEEYFTRNYFQKLVKSKTDVALGIKEGGQLAGIITLKGDYGGVLLVDFLGVGREFRQKGLGKMLLAAAEKWALKHKHHYLWLYTESQKNIDYYQRRGFRYVGTHQGSWFGANEHIMGKQLKDKPFPEVFKNYRRYF